MPQTVEPKKGSAAAEQVKGLSHAEQVQLVQGLPRKVVLKATSAFYDRRNHTLEIRPLGLQVDLFRPQGVRKARRLVRAIMPGLRKDTPDPDALLAEARENIAQALWLAGCVAPNADDKPVFGRFLAGNKSGDVAGNVKALSDYGDDLLS